jgi:hypothetical protein
MKRLGFQYLAKRPCGRVSATCWDDPGHEKSTAKAIQTYVARGDTVERIERFEGDKQPEWICEECRGTVCQKVGAA